MKQPKRVTEAQRERVQELSGQRWNALVAREEASERAAGNVPATDPASVATR